MPPHPTHFLLHAASFKKKKIANLFNYKSDAHMCSLLKKKKKSQAEQK